MSPARLSIRIDAECFPRMSGDEPCSSPPAAFTALFSPREQG